MSSPPSQTLSTAYASEVVPTVLRPYVTAYVCMCWGAGILLSSGVVRAVAGIQGDLGWKLPFYIQWVWPLPLFIGAYLAPESPWNAVRRGKTDEARRALTRLASETPEKEQEIEAHLAYIQYTTELEKNETAGASYLDCFRATNLRRTEIVSITICNTFHPVLIQCTRTALFGLLRSSVVTPSSDSRSSSSRLLDLVNFKLSTSTSAFQHVTLLAELPVGF